MTEQRLTTLTLIWIVLYRFAIEEENEELRDDILESFLVNKREVEKLKLRPTENNDKALQSLLSTDGQAEFRGFSRIIENYNFFRSRITKENLGVRTKRA